MRDSPPRVNDRPGIPGRGVVAGSACAGGREPIACMVRYVAAKGCCAHPLRSVAAVAIQRWYCGGDMAKRARCGDMRAGKRKSGTAVIEYGAGPRHGSVARIACFRIAQGQVIRRGRRERAECGRLLIQGVVAAVASRGQVARVTGRADMALRAGNSCQMRPGQRERRRHTIMIKRRGGPIGRPVANGTILREVRADMVRDVRSVHARGGFCIYIRVAVVAGSRAQRVCAGAIMAGRTRRWRWRNMQPSQRKTCCAVVPRRRSEAHGCVAIGAIGHGKQRSSRGVRRSRGALPAAAIVGVQVATGVSAIRRRDRQGVVAANVAKTASHRCMRIGQRETRGAVIEDAGCPSCNRVAGSTLRRGDRETGGNVVWNVSAHRRAGSEGCRVAPVAIGGAERVVVVHVAEGAGRRQVSTGQSKSGRAVIECCGSKAHGCVAIGAIGHGKQRSGGGVRGSRGALPAAAIVGVQVAAGIPAIGGGNR